MFWGKDKQDKWQKEKRKREYKESKVYKEYEEEFEEDFPQKEKGRNTKSIANTGVPGEKIDLVSGAVYKEGNTKGYNYTPYEPEKTKAGRRELERVVKPPYQNQKKNTFTSFFETPRKPVIKGKLLVICVELSYSETQIVNMINIFVNQDKPKFLKIVLFKNGIYTSAVKFYSDFKEDEILNFIKQKKENSDALENSMKNEKVLLFDAIDEAITYESQIKYFAKKVEKDYEYIANGVKYVFVISGNEKGSKTTKEQVQEMLWVLRKKNSNLHAVVTNFSNLPEISSLGFRSIGKFS